ncbi:MAG: DUF1643 domain-containing protein [Spirochaetales bacterium]|nr:DUF1643 domain-containing protein [Spirochaetales bacterium]
MNNWIYSTDEDNSARFLLGREGEKGLLLTMGINPSTASPEKLDPTVTTVKNRAAELGYDGWCTINVYPQRSTDPNGMDRRRNEALHKENLVQIVRFVDEQRTAGKELALWAAWGALIKKRDYLPNCLFDIHSVLKPFGIKWLSIGKRTKEGHPHHPLYLKKGLPAEIFDVETYLKTLM